MAKRNLFLQIYRVNHDKKPFQRINFLSDEQTVNSVEEGSSNENTAKPSQNPRQGEYPQVAAASAPPLEEMYPSAPPEVQKHGSHEVAMVLLMAEILRSPVEVGSLSTIIYKVLAPSQVVSQISAINSMAMVNE